jgi:hypothetical protein
MEKSLTAFALEESVNNGNKETAKAPCFPEIN